MEPTLPLPHFKPTALHTLVIHLQAVESRTLPASCNRAIHAQVLDWFRQGNPAVSETIHSSQESPLSLSGLMSQHQRVQVRAGDNLYFRVGLLNGSLIEPLLSGLEKSKDAPFYLAKFPFRLRSINMLPGTDPWVGSSDYVLLTETATTLATLTLKFLTPTSFKANSGQEIQPFPLPELVFGSLYRRWNAFAPEELKFPKIQWHGLITDYDLKTQKLGVKNLAQVGVVGWVRYRFPDPEQARIARILAEFAFFSGVGRKTAMGMGQVVLDEQKK
ncbi:MAG TPA: CRISPR-associated endoribonuclease Cas6 [Coleofasciculaceae cyanobacterium]|jgi:CRISPR-associated endoribonuclease Cas6